MKAQRKEHTTRILGKPDDWDKLLGPCEALPITDCNGIMYSYWKPSAMDKLKLLFGSDVRLCVVGIEHPAVMIDTEV